MITGSLDLTKILEAAKNNFSVQLNASKDAPETERKNYIGNLKYAAANQTPVTTEEIPEANDLPF